MNIACKTGRARILGSVAALVALATAGTASPQPDDAPSLQWFLQAASKDEREARAALDRIGVAWKDSYTPLIIDLARLFRPAVRRVGPVESEIGALDDPDAQVTPDPTRPLSEELAAPSPGEPGPRIRSRLIRFLEKQTGKAFGDDLSGWREWMWSLPDEPHADYGEFKGIVYGQIDPRMRAFFPPGVKSLIRLDEVDWGGVTVNGIPPLDYPKHIAASEASYLKDKHVVFGLVVNGDARAYPKRILAWHELARDRVGGVELTVVYCTLCGTVIPYESKVDGVLRRFGTSGLLYRSNKLMFDEETLSLWSALEGAPVVGMLAGSGLTLTTRPVVTTSWAEWKAEHPQTRVLSLDTGHKRDYSEGAAYRDYFSTDRLYFRVSKTDSRLKNKAEVLTMRLAGEGGARAPIAIHAEFLKKNPLYQAELAGRRLVIVTTSSGANRVFEAGDHQFARRLADGRLEDRSGRRWVVTEEALVTEGDTGRHLARVPAQRAFWFGWYAQFPETILIR